MSGFVNEHLLALLLPEPEEFVSGGSPCKWTFSTPSGFGPRAVHSGR